MHDGYVSAPMLEHDFDNDDFGVDAVHAQVLRPRGDPDGMLEQVSLLTKPNRVRELVGGRAIFCITIDIDVGYKDVVFCQRRCRAHEANWPHTLDSIHPAISGAGRIHERHHARWLVLLREQVMIRRRRNSRLEA